jgi:hypothetical protein
LAKHLSLFHLDSLALKPTSQLVSHFFLTQECKHYTLQLPGGVSDTDTFTILAGEQKNIAITFTPHQEITEKEYPLSLVFFTKPLNEIDATGVE